MQAGTTWRNEPWLAPSLAALLVAIACLLASGASGLSLAAAATVGLAAVIARRPVQGTWLTLLLLPYSLYIYGNNLVSTGTDAFDVYVTSFLNVAAFQVVALVTALVVAVELLTGRRSWVRTPCGRPFLLWTLMACLSVLASAYMVESLRQIVKLLFGLWPLAWIMIQTLRTRRDVEIGLLAFLIGSVANALVGLAQVVLAAVFGYRLYAAQTVLPNGLTGESTMFGISLSLALAVALPIAWQGAPRRLFPIACAVLPALLIGITLSGNRTGWAAALLVIAVTLGYAWRPGRGLLLLALSAAVVIAGFLLAKSVAPRWYDMVAHKVTHNESPRIIALGFALETWRNPLWGNGVGTFMPHLAAVDANLYFANLTPRGPLFNLFAGALYDTGVLGLLALLWLLAEYVRAWRLARPAPGDGAGEALRLVALLLFLTLLLHAQFHPSWGMGISYVLFALGLVICRRYVRPPVPGQLPSGANQEPAT